TTNFVLHLFRIHVQSGSDEVGVGVQIAGGIAQKKRRHRAIVVNDGASVLVNDLSPRRKNGHVADAVLLSQRGIHIALRNLQPPQAIGQKKKDDEDDVLYCRQAHLRGFFFAAEHKDVVIVGRRSSAALPWWDGLTEL